MANDKSKRDFRDRDRVSADEDYEAEYFARHVTPQQVKDLAREQSRDAGGRSEASGKARR
jgi:hypothetical protein